MSSSATSTVSPGTSVCASALDRINNNEAVFYFIHNIFLGLYLPLTNGRSARSVHTSQHTYKKSSSSILVCWQEIVISTRNFKFSFPEQNQKHCSTDTLSFSACAGSLRLGLVTTACVTKHLDGWRSWQDLDRILPLKSCKNKTGLVWIFTSVLAFDKTHSIIVRRACLSPWDAAQGVDNNK